MNKLHSTTYRTIQWLFAVMFLTFSSTAMSQQKFIEVGRIPCQASMITADHMGHLYTIEGSTLNCRDSSGIVLYSYSDLNNGTLSYADVTDPLKIILFSSDFSTLSFLDQKLTIKGSPMHLQSMGVSNGTLACNSYESGFWIYDASLIQLLRFNKQAIQEQNTENISSLTGVEIHPCFLAELDNVVYLCDTAAGILMFDRYGGYLKTLPIKRVRSIQGAGEHLIFCTDKELIAYKTNDHTLTALPLPVVSLSACIWHEKLYLLTNSELIIYRMY